jgi:hypothetical protein
LAGLYKENKPRIREPKSGILAPLRITAQP